MSLAVPNPEAAASTSSLQSNATSAKSRSKLAIKTPSSTSVNTITPESINQDDQGNKQTQSPTEIEDEMSEQELRELYDNEEIDRFLHLFSAYVTEVRLPGTDKKLTKSTTDKAPADTQTTTDEEVTDEEANATPWVALAKPPDDAPTIRKWPPQRSLAESIAYKYVIPILPPPPMPPQPFTLGRMRLTAQRFYLATAPLYGPLFRRLGELATWKNRRQSALWCAVYWTLWWYNLLAPALVFRIIIALVSRRIFAYPSLEQLRERRREVARAEALGEELTQRLNASGSSVKEVFRLFKVFTKPKKAKASQAKGKGKDKSAEAAEKEEDAEGATVLDEGKEDKVEKDTKRGIMNAMSEIADLHERFRNLFIWRKPASSRIYGAAFFVIFLILLLLPAQTIAKLTYFIAGLFFWHIAPIVASLPPNGRARIPPAFDDLPTDADYAMEIISQRVAAGLDVKPSRPPKKNSKNTKDSSKKNKSQTGPKSDAETTGKDAEEETDKDEVSEAAAETDTKVDWKKWGERTAVTKNWVDSSKRLMTGGQWTQGGEKVNPLVPQPALAVGAPPEPPGETYSFPAQHTYGPGLITMTPSMLYFTPLMNPRPKVTVPLSAVAGVKKMGVLKGMLLKWVPADQEEEKEEWFTWVGGRDELFARLIGSGGTRWLKA